EVSCCCPRGRPLFARAAVLAQEDASASGAHLSVRVCRALASRHQRSAARTGFFEAENVEGAAASMIRTGLELDRGRPLQSPVPPSAPTRNAAFPSAPDM